MTQSGCRKRYVKHGASSRPGTDRIHSCSLLSNEKWHVIGCCCSRWDSLWLAEARCCHDDVSLSPWQRFYAYQTLWHEVQATKPLRFHLSITGLSISKLRLTDRRLLANSSWTKLLTKCSITRSFTSITSVSPGLSWNQTSWCARLAVIIILSVRQSSAASVDFVFTDQWKWCFTGKHAVQIADCRLRNSLIPSTMTTNHQTNWKIVLNHAVKGRLLAVVVLEDPLTIYQ